MPFICERQQLLVALAFFISFDLCESNKQLYLLDLYTCVDEYEDYCNQIPRLTVRAAIELANNRDDMLPGYTLCTAVNRSNEVTSILSDGKVIITSGIIDNFYKEFDAVMSLPNSTVSPVVLGSPFGFVNEYTVDILGNHQNFVQVNYKPTTANVSSSPFFYWIGPNQAFFNAVQLQLLVRNSWRQVGILSSLDEFNSTADDLEKILRKNDISVINTESFTIEGGLNGNQIHNLKDEDVRIIIALITVIEVPLIMCTAYEIGLIDDRHVWILPQMNLNDIRRVAEKYNNTCNIDTVLRNALMVGEYYYSSENHSLPFTKTDVDDLLMKYTNTTNLTEIPGYNLSKVVFDATWAAILVLNNSVQQLAKEGWSLEESINQNGVDQNISDKMKESLNEVKFLGFSGMVDFSDSFRMSNLSTNGSFYKASVSQITNNSSCVVEIYNDTGVISVSNSNFCKYTWGNDPPVSDGLIDHPQVPAALLIFTIMGTVAFLFVSMAAIIFSVLLRNHRYMKTFSVTVNTVIVVGCMMMFMGTLPLLLIYGVEQYDVNKEESNALCYVNLCVDRIGYTLFCIGLLLKTWRLYKIKINKLLKKKLRFVSNKAMLIFAVILLFPVALMISLQFIIDRPKLVTELLDIKDGYPYEHIQYTYCNQNQWYLWRILQGVYDCGILVHTYRQAGHVSNMSFKTIAYEGDISIRLLLMMTIFLTSYLLIVVILLLANHYYESTVIFIFGSTTLPAVMISMIFLPKVYVIVNDYMQAKRKRNSDVEKETESTIL